MVKPIDVFEYMKRKNLYPSTALKYPEFRKFFKDKKISTIVEIGTYWGVSAAYMACYANRIFTFDTVDHQKKYKVWCDLGVMGKMSYYTIKGGDDVKKVIDGIKFDFAFIDGEHTYEAVKADFEIVKHCGKVLFHDVALDKCPGVGEFAREIGAKFIDNLGYWRK